MATTEKFIVKKQKQKSMERNEDNIGGKKDKKKGMKLSHLKKKRLIIRNLSFKVEEKELKKIFSKFGEILDVKIPLKSDGKKRGFAFVQFNDTKSMIKAMKNLNFQKIYGRPIAIDFAVNKDTYLSRLNNSNSHSKRNNFKQEIKSEEVAEDSDNESITDSKRNSLKQEIKSEVETEDSENESFSLNNSQETCHMQDESDDDKVKEFFKEFDVDDEELHENSGSETSEESSEDGEHESSYSNEHDNHNDSYNTGKKSSKRKQYEDLSEGKTVFIRNISFKNIEEDLQEVVEEFGETVYCLFCNDPITGHFRGTAFVKFKEKKSAEKLIEESSKEPGILLDGRKLLCTNAVSREELSNRRESSEKNKDKRNLRLLKCGLVAYGSKEAEGVSQADMAKRTQLEAVKKQKLRNINFFVSDKRLVCHNIPKNLNDKDLYQMFKKAGGNGSLIKEARIMKDFKKTDAQGNPMSRGFAFVAFTEHEHALKALNELNNNPNVFTANKRPIVEFSVENKVALLSQKRRQEKVKMQNKKRMEQCNNWNSQETNNQQSSDTVSVKFSKQRVQKDKKQSDINNPSDEVKHFQKKGKQTDINRLSEETVSQKKKKKQKKGKQKHCNPGRNEISALTQMYKEKLFNKLS